MTSSRWRRGPGQGQHIVAPDEIPWRTGFRSDDELRERGHTLVAADLRRHLRELLAPGQDD